MIIIPCIEMFAGVGGIRLGLEQANHRGFLQEAKEGKNLRRSFTDIKERQDRVESRGISVDSEQGLGNEEEWGEPRLEGRGRGQLKEFRCVWANDWEYADFKWKPNKKTGKLEWKGQKNHSGKIYRRHWNDGTYIDADIRSIDPDTIPDHDLLTAGFPCPSFSVAGKRMGFQDPRGTLFREILRVAEAKKPKVLLLENVRGLLSIDRGQAFATILQELGRIGYWVEWQIFNSKHHGVPQNRERVFIIGHLRGSGGREVFPILEAREIIDERVSKEQVVSALQSSGHASGNYRGMTMIEQQPTSLLYWKNSKERWVQEDRRDTPTLKSQSDLVRQPLVLDFNQDGNIYVKKESATLRTPKASQSNLLVKGVTLANTSRYKQGVNRSPLKQDDQSFALNSAGDQGVLLKVGNIVESGHDSLWGRVYDPEGLASNLNAKGGGVGAKTGLYIVADRTRSYAGKGRNLESPKKMTNALSGVQKDNLLVANAVDCDGYLRFGHRPRDENGKPQLIPIGYRRIRRLTPIECERLQAFPDRWTELGLAETQQQAFRLNCLFVGRWLKKRFPKDSPYNPWFNIAKRYWFRGINSLQPLEYLMSDTSRYKCLGNAVTTNVITFLGERLLERCF